MRDLWKAPYVTVEVEPNAQTRRFGAGTVLVRTGQELGALVVQLLEPESEDGLCAWNFFDARAAGWNRPGRHLKEGATFPVVRLLDPVPLTRCAVRPLPEDREMNRRITFEAVYEGAGARAAGKTGSAGGSIPLRGRLSFSGSPVSGLRWLDDGEHFLQTKDKRLYKVHAVSGRCEPFCDVDQMAAALADLPTIDEETAQQMAKRTRFQLSKDVTAALFEHENDLYYYRFDGSPAPAQRVTPAPQAVQPAARAVRLTHTPQREELSSFSPDGAFVAFVRDFEADEPPRVSHTHTKCSTTGALNPCGPFDAHTRTC